MKQHPIYKDYLFTEDGKAFGPSGRQLKSRLSSKTSKILSILIKYEGRSRSVSLKRLVFETFNRVLTTGEELECIDGDEANCQLNNINIIGSGYTWYPHPLYPEYKAEVGGRILGKSGRYINPVLCSKTGYLRITLKDKDNKSIPKLSHRFIYECLSGEVIPDKLTIDHIDGDKTNNVYSNLDLVSQKVNNFRAKALGLNKAHCENSPQAKLTDREVLEIRQRIGAGEKISEMYEDYSEKVKVDALYAIKQNRNWKRLE